MSTAVQQTGHLFHIDYLGLSAPAAMVRIRGLTPLLMSNPAPMFDKQPSSKGRNTPPDDPEVVAERSAYRTADGGLYLPSVAIRSSIMRGAVGYKVSKETAQKYLGDMFVLPEDKMLLMRNGAPITTFERDSRRAVNKTTKGGIITHRALIQLPWEIYVTIGWYKGMAADTDNQNAQFISVLLETGERSGRQVGLGAFRPEKTGWFGRYALELA